MKFKKIDVLISENLTREQLKDKILPQLNLLITEQDKTGSSIYYIANIHDVNKGKYWICVDTETKETLGLPDELIDLQSIQNYTTENPDEAAKDILYSSEYIEEFFLRKLIFEDYRTANDQRLTDLEQLVQTNEEDIEKKNRDTNVALNVLDQEVKANKSEYDEKINEIDQFVQDTNANINALNDVLATKAEIAGTGTQTFHVADATEPTHAVSLKQLQDTTTSNNSSIDEFKEEYHEHINQVDSNIAQLFDTFGGLETEIDKKANSSDVYSKEEIDNNIAGMSIASLPVANDNTGEIILNTVDDIDTVYGMLFNNSRMRYLAVDTWGARKVLLGSNLILNQDQATKFFEICSFTASQVYIQPVKNLSFKPKITFNLTKTITALYNPVTLIHNIDVEVNFTGAFQSLNFVSPTVSIINVNFTFNQENANRWITGMFLPTTGTAIIKRSNFKINVANTNAGVIFGGGSFTPKPTIILHGELNINTDTPNLKVFISQSRGMQDCNLYFTSQTAANSNLDFTRILLPVTVANIDRNTYNKIRFNSLNNGTMIIGQGSYYPAGDITQQTV